MAQVKLSATELIAISTLIENAAERGKKESTAGLYIDFMYMPPTQCKMLADILQNISTEFFHYRAYDERLCEKLRDAAK